MAEDGNTVELFEDLVILVVLTVGTDFTDIKYVDNVPNGEAEFIELKTDVYAEFGVSDLDVLLKFSLVPAELELDVVEVTIV